MPPPTGQSDFALRVHEASAAERSLVELLDGPVASDACVVVYVARELIGWGDDYGTFRELRESGVTREHGEALLQAATGVWEDRTVIR